MRTQDLKSHHPRSLITEERRGEIKRRVSVALIVALVLGGTVAVVFADGIDEGGTRRGPGELSSGPCPVQQTWARGKPRG
jgi:hypothetical protein